MSHEERGKLAEQLEFMKGRPFTISVLNGRKYRMALYDMKGDHVVLKSVRKARNDQVQTYGGLSLLFPISFFQSLLYGPRDLEDISDILD